MSDRLLLKVWLAALVATLGAMLLTLPWDEHPPWVVLAGAGLALVNVMFWARRVRDGGDHEN